MKQSPEFPATTPVNPENLSLASTRESARKILAVIQKCLDTEEILDAIRLRRRQAGQPMTLDELAEIGAGMGGMRGEMRFLLLDTKAFINKTAQGLLGEKPDAVKLTPTSRQIDRALEKHDYVAARDVLADFVERLDKLQ